MLYLIKTGPKGVVKDYMRFKQLEREQNEAEKEELELLTKKFSMTCRTNVIFFKRSIMFFYIIKLVYNVL